MIFYVLTAFNFATSVLCATRKDTLRLPEFDFPRLDPFFYDYGKNIINRGEIHGEITVFNVTVIGLRNTHLLSLRSYIRDDKYHFKLDIEIPKLVINGNANAIGSLSGIIINGKGHFNIIVENVEATCYVIGHAENYTLVLEHIQINPTIEKMKFHLDDFFEGNRELNNFLETFVNEFWPLLYRTVIPIASDVWDSWLTNFCNRYLSKISISQIFP
ncbi:uncharacterized protein [Anoplolepis gracilipes]|uniref:uncharacterized protein isoform X2 n=1 Tax=Anoplolepis gracilipes TaxID=354296 RepID=UPI003BA0C8DA